jgi:hypothetical protein
MESRVVKLLSSVMVDPSSISIEGMKNKGFSSISYSSIVHPRVILKCFLNLC